MNTLSVLFAATRSPPHPGMRCKGLESAIARMAPLGLTISIDGAMDLILAPVALPQPDWVIQLEWARIEAPRDSSLSTERFVPFVPSHSLKGLSWSQNPSKVQVKNMFSAGVYAVRAQVAGDAEEDWTAWHRFAIGTVSLETATRNRPGMSEAGKVKKVKPIPPP